MRLKSTVFELRYRTDHGHGQTDTQTGGSDRSLTTPSPPPNEGRGPDGQVNSNRPNLRFKNKKHLKNVGPIRHNEPPHAHSPGVASGIVACRLRIDVHDEIDNDNA